MANNFKKKYEGRNNKYKSKIFYEKVRISRKNSISYDKIDENYYKTMEEVIKEICENENE